MTEYINIGQIVIDDIEDEETIERIKKIRPEYYKGYWIGQIVFPPTD